MVYIYRVIDENIIPNFARTWKGSYNVNLNRKNVCVCVCKSPILYEVEYNFFFSRIFQPTHLKVFGFDVAPYGESAVNITYLPTVKRRYSSLQIMYISVVLCINIKYWEPNKPTYTVYIYLPSRIEFPKSF